MIKLIVFISLLSLFLVNYIISSKLDKNTAALRDSIRFFVSSTFVVVLLSWFANLTSPENLSGTVALDKLITFNAVVFRIRNIIIVASLFYLAVGTYSEYIGKKKKLQLVIFLVLLSMSVLYLVGSMMADSFIL
jgi:hypothetical protein